MDRDLAMMVHANGTPPLWARRPGFATLVRIILEQQVTLESGAAAYRRLSNALGRTTPKRVLDHTHMQLRRLGLTRQKARYCLELAGTVESGQLDLASLDPADPEQVRAELTKITGIGLWTADVYLLMALGHPDIWPRGDIALYQSLRSAKSVDWSPERIDKHAQRWRPWRAVAARILWQHYLCSRKK